MIRFVTLVFLCLGLYTQAADGFTTPEKYGAVGNGLADDTAAFLLALNESQMDQIPVVLDSKTYVLSQTLVFSTGMSMVGKGSELTILKFSDLPVAIRSSGFDTHVPDVENNVLHLDQLIRLEGFTVEASLRPNISYKGIALQSVDRPIVRDIKVLNVSVDEAIYFHHCANALKGDIRDLSAENCSYTNLHPDEAKLSHGVIRFKYCQDMFVENISVINSTGQYPAHQRDAVLVTGCERLTFDGLRGIQVDSLFDVGNSVHCYFENLYGRDVQQAPVYLNNSTRFCTIRNGHFENSDFGIVIASSTDLLEERGLDRHNVLENLTFHNVGKYVIQDGQDPPLTEDPRPGIWIRAAAGDNTKAPHDNVFRNIHFVDNRDSANFGLSILIDEDMDTSILGRNTYTHVTVDSPQIVSPLPQRIVAKANGSNLDGLERRLGRYEIDLSLSPSVEGTFGPFRIEGIDKIYGVNVSVNASTDDSGTQVQYINASVTGIIGNRFMVVLRTTDGQPFSTHTSEPITFFYEVFAE